MSKDIKRILLIGRTGNGKSTLGNVLINKNDEFDAVFEESGYATSETRETKTGEFEVAGIKYQVIDTIGIGDTQLDDKEVLYKIGEAAHKVRDGLNQIFFVTSGRFTKEERFAYNLLREIIFDDNIVKYTTIIRTNFENFQEESENKKDKEKMISENEELAEVIRSCNKVIHVNNPPTNTNNLRRLKLNKEDREISRSKILLHLGNLKDDNYRPPNLDGLNMRISEHMTEIEKLQKQLEDSKDLSETQRREMQELIDELKEKVSENTKGWFQRAGALAGEAVDNAINFVKTAPVKAVEKIVGNSCNLM